eukprot:TRINITY_DN35051_c0_g1_i1.p1 TRINITY_DN35051_c0_g1~~TRINITY_DN35051_c0_g1_i1.p1  ORF type:complete len:344 (-),score=42.91 TRINITY_DN35051_c0_g1_i1:334-1365(-)
MLRCAPPGVVVIRDFARGRILSGRGAVALRANCTGSVHEGPYRIGLIGFGAIGADVARMINGLWKEDKHSINAVVSAVLVRNTHRPDYDREVLADSVGILKSAGHGEGLLLTDCPDVFFQHSFDICVESAGQPVVKEFGTRSLTSGKDFLVTSIGAFTNEDLYAELRTLAVKHGRRLELAAGSMPALDWMHSAALLHEHLLRTDMAGKSSELKVTVTQQKPPKSWFGTPAEQEFDLSALQTFTTLFEGPAKIASSRYPKNSNVATMLALATAGVDKTNVKLVTDPLHPERSGTIVEFESDFVGKIRIEVESKQSLRNPKTSIIVPAAVVKAVKNLCAPVVIGA